MMPLAELLSPSRRRERGSIAVEMAFLAPVLLLILGLIWAYARVSWANSHLDTGARDAARVATNARSEADAREAAARVVHDATAAVPACQETLTVELTGTFEPGATITVTATCTYAISQIGLPGAPGTMSPSSSFSAVIDQYRGVDP